MSWDDKDAWERFEHGMKAAIANCRELSRAMGKPSWNMMATQFENILASGKRIYNEKPMSRQNALKMLDGEIEKMLKKQDAKKEPKTGLMH